eukprot:scaffold682_cov363-Pavlova_lutheri.AAC.9
MKAQQRWQTHNCVDKDDVSRSETADHHPRRDWSVHADLPPSAPVEKAWSRHVPPRRASFLGGRCTPTGNYRSMFRYECFREHARRGSEGRLGELPRKSQTRVRKESLTEGTRASRRGRPGMDRVKVPVIPTRTDEDIAAEEGDRFVMHPNADPLRYATFVAVRGIEAP